MVSVNCLGKRRRLRPISTWNRIGIKLNPRMAWAFVNSFLFPFKPVIRNPDDKELKYFQLFWSGGVGKGRFPLRKISIRSDQTGLVSILYSPHRRTKNRLKILQFFIFRGAFADHRFKLEQKIGTESPCACSILFRSDPILIFLSRNRPLSSGSC